MRSKITRIALFSILLSGIFSVNAQTWEKLASLPEGGSIKDLTADNSSVYALSNSGSEIYYTADNGMNWQLLPGTFAFWNITNIEADKTTGTLYVGTLSHGIRWTSDKGTTWQYQLFYVLPESGDGATIVNMARKSNAIVASEPLGTQTEFYVSANAGATWNAVNTDFAYTTALEFISNGLLLAGTENGISVSANNGLTWSPLNNGLAGKQITSIAEKSASSKLFVAATFNNVTENTSGCGIYVSSNGGASWSLSSNGIADTNITSIAVDETGGAIYATASSGVYKSVDDGENWALVANGTSGSGFKATISNTSGVFCASTISGISYLATPAADWVQRNHGLSVSSINTLCVSPAGNVYTFDNGISGVYNLDNAGWAHASGIGLPEALGRDFTRDGNGILYASYVMQHNGLYRSDDNGATWTSIATMALPSDIYYVDFSKIIVDSNNNLYAKADYSSDLFIPSQIFKSADHGATWSTVYTLDTTAFAALTDIDLSSDGKIYISVTDFAFQAKIFASADNGATFTILPVDLDSVFGYADLVVAPDHSLYLCQFNHVYKQNALGNWVQLPDGGWNGLDTHPTKLYIDGQNNLYVTCRDFGVWFSSNSGATWANISNGLPVYTTPFSGDVLVSFTALQFDGNNIVYGINSDAESGDNRGIYTLNNPLETIGHAYEANGFQVSPNPVIGLCRISGTFNLNATVKIDNILGQSMSVVPLATLKTGENEYALDLSSFPSGFYIVQIQNGNEVSEQKIIKK